MTCPRCGRDTVRRSRRANAVERLGGLLGFYPFRCELCAHRFWRRTASVAPAPPAAPAPGGGAERRRHERVPARIMIGIQWEAAEGAGTLRDVSLGGGSVETDAPLAEGMLVQLTLPPDGTGDPLAVSQAVVRSARTGRLGLEFVDLSPEERERLAQLLARLLRGEG